jgi:hypothetical protein
VKKKTVKNGKKRAELVVFIIVFFQRIRIFMLAEIILSRLTSNINIGLQKALPNDCEE